MSTNEMLKEENVKNKAMKKVKINKMGIMTIIMVWAIVFVSLIKVSDYVKLLSSKSSSYQIKYEKEETLENDQKVYRLYKDDIEYGDVDINKYSLVDDKGNTDYKYCYLMDITEETVGILFIAIIYILVILMVRNSNNGPFNKKNCNYLRIISIMMLCFAVVPGMVRFVMSIVRFSYVSGSFDIKLMYMLLVSCAIAVIAQVFDYGVKLQEDSDSII